MRSAQPNPLLLPLTGLLKNRGVRVAFNCQLDKDIGDATRPNAPRMKELRITVPLLASHRLHNERRMVIGIGNGLEAWRAKLSWRGINLLSVSADGLCGNVDGIADQVCAHMFRVSVEELRDMIQAGMNYRAIWAFTGIEPSEIARMVPRFYGMTIQELRESQ